MPLDRVNFLNAGHCSQWSYLAGGSFWSLTRFHAVFVYLHHPQYGGAIIDTGYSQHFFEATRRFPGRLYRWLTPVNCPPGVNARSALEAQGISSDDVRFVFVSHFHGDHIAGLKLFPKATFVYRRESYESLLRLGAWAQVRQAFLADAMPADFIARSKPIEENTFVPGSGVLSSFPTLDYFGDGSLVLVDLPGHADGHTGYVLSTATEQHFYVVDATWWVESLLAKRRLPWLSRKVQHDYSSYAETQQKLVALAAAGGPELVACHCPRTQRLVAKRS